MYTQKPCEGKNIYDLVSLCKEDYGEKPAIAENRKNGIYSKDFIEFYNITTNIAKYLKSRFKQEHITLFGKGNAAYIIFYTALMMSGNVCVPVDTEQDAEDAAYVITHSDSSVCLYDKKSEKKIGALKDKLSGITDYICFDDVLEEYASLGENIKEDITAAKPEDLAVIIYTSGTTGKPKGVMLSQKNICAVAGGAGKHVDVYESVLSILPLHHSYGCMCGVYSILSLGKTVYVSRGLKYFLKELNQFSPSNLFVVPLFVTTFEKSIKGKIAEQGKQKLVARMIKLSDGLRKIGINLSRKFFKSIIAGLGGNIKVIVSGGASLDTETEKFFDSIGIIINNGYGITECAPLVCVNHNLTKKVGSVGPALPYCKVKIDDPDEDGKGEILVYGDNVMMGYYKDKAATDAVFKEGWFRTGDIGYIDGDGYVFISGRIKNLIILHNGKNINPEDIEDKLLRIPYIKEVVVYSKDSEKLLAEVYIAEEDRTADILSRLEADIETFNVSQPYYKRIANVTMRKEEFEKTSTKKIKRFTVI